MEEAHKEALAIAEERWPRIFNHNRPVGGRAHDPPDRKMVSGKPEDMAKHPGGEDHIRLWDLPRLSAMVMRVKGIFQAILGKRLHVMTQGYIESIIHVRQLPHRDFQAASLPWMASPSPCSRLCGWTSLMMRFARSSSRCLPVRSLGLGSSTTCR